MKKLLTISMMVVIIMCLVKTNTTAAMQCNVTLDSLETNGVTVKDEFVVEAKVSDISSIRGLVSLGATLEYNKKSLKLKSIQGVGDYSTPAFNEENGKILIERDPTNHNATMFTMTFEVLNTDNVKVELTKISVSDGTGLTTLDDQSYTPTIKQEVTPTPTPTPGPGGDDNKPNQPGDSGNNKPGQDGDKENNNPQIPDTTTKDDKLPQTGDNKTLVIGGISGLVLLGLTSYIKFLDLNKKIIR